MATTYTTNYHLGKQTDHSDKFSMDVITDNMDIIDTQLKTQSDKIDAAAAGIKYKGEVNYYADLPTTGVKIGDAYTVKYAGTSGTTPDGTEYVWGTVSSTNQWINFSKDSYTKAEVDALLAGKQAALTTAQLAAVNSGIDSTKVAQIETNKNNILSIPRTDMDRLPFTFTANSAGNLKGYTIYGNSDKVGIQTVNLFDKANTDNRLIYPAENNGEVIVPTSSWTYSLTIAVEPNTTYTISKVASVRRRLAGYSAYPNIGDTAEFVVNTYTTDSGRDIVTFTTTANTHYVLFYYLNASSAEPTPERIADLINSVQLELGSAMTGYEPYGYKIPITCGGVTTNVYCDAQLDKGDMLTLGESEINIPVLSGSNTITTTLTNKPTMWIKYE